MIFDFIKPKKKNIPKDIFFATIEFTEMAEELIVGGNYAKVICERLFRRGNIYLVNKFNYSEARINNYHKRNMPVIDRTISGIPIKELDLPEAQIILGHIAYEG